MKNSPRPVFYISAITIQLAKEYIWNNVCCATSDSSYTTIICDGGVICA